MTPFGEAVRKLRSERGISQRQMAREIGVSPAYLSALEHGHRSKPSWQFVQRVIGYFNVIWDDAEELMESAGLSDPKININTSGLQTDATEVANLMAKHIKDLQSDDFTAIKNIIHTRIAKKPIIKQ